MKLVSRDIDLQRIRKEHKVTQKHLAELTQYPQSFISQIENRRVNAPVQFQQKLMDILGITSLEPYYLPSPMQEAAKGSNQGESGVAGKNNDQQLTINRLLDIIDRRDERIRELESENKRLTELLLQRKD